MNEVGYARPEDLHGSIVWALDDDGTLNGELRVRNVSDRPVRVAGKPVLTPLGTDGAPLGAQTVVTLELRLPDYVDLEPGEQAVTGVGWAGWDGPRASGEMLVDVSGAQIRLTVSGPPQPAATGPATNLESSWFDRLENTR